MVTEALQRKLDQLPTEPGVYLFRDAAGELLYVGKAARLRSRVRSYFQSTSDGRLATFFIDKYVADVEFVITRSEKEALLLENNLIKKLKPRYNLRLRDDKTFLSLRLDPRADFPRIVPTRRIHKDGALYFGPYANAGAIRRTLRFLRSFVPLRDCKDTDFKSRTRPCLEHEIGRCNAPCVGMQSREEYAQDVARAVRILRGDADELIAQVKDEMQRASDRMHYERAAVLRDHLESLSTSIEKQGVDTHALGDADAIGVHREGGLTEVVVLHAREGKLVSTSGFTFEHDLPQDELLGEFLAQFYSGGRPIPELILLTDEPYGRDTLVEWLRERRGGAVELRVPKHGEKARLLELAAENARLTLLASTDKQRRTAGVLDRLRQRFGLTRPPLWIECLDASTTAGKDTVASCVAFKDGEPWKARYRKFRIKTARPDDEYASIAEAVERRYARAIKEQQFPDLVIIDGGKGQWNAARTVLDALGVKNVDLISIAKGGRRGKGLVLGVGEEERVFTRGEGEPFVLEPEADDTKLLQRIRDEAHRFAIEFHRKSRSRTSLTSELDAIDGIGPTRRKALLLRFGSVAGMRSATVDELAAVDGMNMRAAHELHAQLRATDSTKASE
jgi:excinuclease ABC subunit C